MEEEYDFGDISGAFSESEGSSDGDDDLGHMFEGIGDQSEEEEEDFDFDDTDIETDDDDDENEVIPSGLPMVGGGIANMPKLNMLPQTAALPAATMPVISTTGSLPPPAVVGPPKVTMAGLPKAVMTPPVATTQTPVVAMTPATGTLTPAAGSLPPATASVMKPATVGLPPATSVLVPAASSVMKPATVGLPPAAGVLAPAASSVMKPATVGLPPAAGVLAPATSSVMKPATVGLPPAAGVLAPATSSVMKPATAGLAPAASGILGGMKIRLNVAPTEESIKAKMAQDPGESDDWYSYRVKFVLAARKLDPTSTDEKAIALANMARNNMRDGTTYSADDTAAISRVRSTMIA